MQTKDLLGTHYRLYQRIADLGTRTVWAARQELLGRPVALELLHPHLAADDGFRRRLPRRSDGGGAAVGTGTVAM